MGDTPELVAEAARRAAAVGFARSCAPEVGQFLAVLAAAVPRHGRVLELGTGAGVGLAWIVHGLRNRPDVNVVSVERDPLIAEIATSAERPSNVQILVEDAVRYLTTEGSGFDLVFADAEGGKWRGLKRTIDALRSGGHLLVDDMSPPVWEGDHHREMTEAARRNIFESPELLSVELALGSGIILSTRISVE